ncbi:putative adenylosuccinate lyase [Besnoitia besnoiti]|uniref:Adenylosuccinate lyase n=1 Tax=Besnoitia besnoiti TaxID=94643 RepID=A0A2A9MKK9_BESBE|nr:putative adenylosuccinate lyase [Besnoitia besnoiti]PFH37754.1 putative adenylosuccinate lyase [Besnoitia besnoiti]
MASPSPNSPRLLSGASPAEVELLALSPLDGRYAYRVSCLRSSLSEYSLIEKRAFVMTEWLVRLASHPAIHKNPAKQAGDPLFFPHLSEDGVALMRTLGAFSLVDAVKVKEVEKKTNHDLKAVEYILKEKLACSEETAPLAAFTHFGCTSEDVNNLAWALSFKQAVESHILPCMESLADILHRLAGEFADVPLLSRTHGQAATPTTFGKEMANFEWRMRNALRKIRDVEFRGKCNGAVGNFNALVIADREVDWPLVAKDMIEGLGLVYQPYSTQIEQHDWLAELCHAVARFNSILLDLDRDLWLYISRDLLKLRVVPGEVGSSTMPHKVNPIDFENSEGNLQLANALLQFFSAKFPVSRLQRDLSDTTVLRNVGVALGHSLVAYESTKKGLNRVDVNRVQMLKELDENWAVLAEPVQTLLRKMGVKDAYEKLKTATRGQSITQDRMKEIIQSCRNDLPPRDAACLEALTPATYTGLASDLATKVVETVQEEEERRTKMKTA